MHELTTLFREPGAVSLDDAYTWNLLLHQARKNGVMAKLEAHLHKHDLWKSVPPTARETMQGSTVFVEFIQRRVCYELSALERQLSSVPFPVVLLKGAAYIATRSAPAAGRGVRDIDILVEKRFISQLEDRLRACGWRFAEELNAYDEYYYRELSHELPPLQHPEFQFELDVHHDLLPPTMRIGRHTSEMMHSLVEVPGSRFLTLQQQDQLIHSAVHLMTSETLNNGLRDLLDMAALAQCIVEDLGSVEPAIERARHFDLDKPLIDALSACHRHLGTPLALPTNQGRERQTFTRRLVAWIIDNVVFPTRKEKTLLTVIASNMMWWKGQYLRMPLWQLLKHAVAKKLVVPFRQRGATNS